MSKWQDISTAPKDGTHILVWYDHDEDPYQDTENPGKLTSYAVWAEGGDYLTGKGICVAAWQPQFWESEDEYGGGYWLPAWWFESRLDDYEFAVNPTHWMPLPDPPQ